MAEKLYTIPVNEAFETDCECPVCLMYKTLETNAVDFTMGPSYMEDDVRIATNKSGFCDKHVKQLYAKQNRLGLALMMLSHMSRSNDELDDMKDKTSKGGFFKKAEESGIGAYYKNLEESCFICDKVDETFDRYIATIFHLYRQDKEFENKMKNSKGFCMKHYALLFERAKDELSGGKTAEFRELLNKVYYENINRVKEDLQGFIDKFDYRNAEKPWGNSKDALIRAIKKMNSTDVE